MQFQSIQSECEQNVTHIRRFYLEHEIKEKVKRIELLNFLS